MSMCKDRDNETRSSCEGFVYSECRRQVKKIKNVVKNVKIMEFHDYIWNHHEKCIQISTNMPGIGLVNREIAVTISEMGESKHGFAQ